MGDAQWQMCVAAAPDDAFAGFLRTQIRAFNDAHSPPHRAARRPGAVRPLHVMLEDARGEIIGGLAGSTYWDWLEIEHFYVPAELRGQGVGSSLLTTAETEARRRGALHAFLTTFSFQARTFYAKRGYIVVGTLEGYPPGSAYFWMRKELTDHA